MFNSRYAPRYGTPFGIAMAFVGLAIITASVTWWVTGRVDVETPRSRRQRLAALRDERKRSV